MADVREIALEFFLDMLVLSTVAGQRMSIIRAVPPTIPVLAICMAVALFTTAVM